MEGTLLRDGAGASTGAPDCSRGPIPSSAILPLSCGRGSHDGQPAPCRQPAPAEQAALTGSARD